MLNKVEAAQIERIAKLVTAAKGSWFGLLSYISFVGVTLLGVQDADFFITSRQTELPLIGVSVPTNLFFHIAPGLGAMIYIYFHLHLLKLWEELSRTPAHINNAPLSDHIAPWLIADYALAQRTDNALRQRPLGKLAHYVVGALAFWAAPLVLAAFWFRSMLKHDPWLTGLAIGVPLLLSIYVGKRSHEHLIVLMKPRSDTLATSKWSWSLVVAITLFFGQVASNGFYADTPRMEAFNKWAGWPKRANFSGVAFTQTPDDWQDFDDARNTKHRDWCKQQGISSLACGTVNYAGSILSDDLIFARKNWCEEFLEVGRNCTEYFVSLDRQFADVWERARSLQLAKANTVDLRYVDLRLADLDQVGLEGANLQGTRIEGASFNRARLERAILTWSKLPGSDFRGARLELANFLATSMDNTDFRGARMEGTILAWTQLNGANFRGARLERADLRSATLYGADFSDARLDGAIFYEARMDDKTSLVDASLRGAAFREVDYTNVAWEQSQLDQSFGDASVILPKDIDRPPHWPDWKMDWATFDAEWDKWKDDPASYIPPENPS